MRFFASAAFVTAASLAAATASAAEPAPAAAPPVAASPPAASPPAAAPPPSYGPTYPGYPSPSAVYGAPGGAPAPLWMAPPPVTERRSNAMRITGIALFATGGLISGLGAVLLGVIGPDGCLDEVSAPTGGGAPPSGADAVHERVRAARQRLDICETSPGLSFALLAAGGVTALVGVPLYVLGTQQVPVQPQSQSRNLVPTVSLGSHSASLRWTF